MALLLSFVCPCRNMDLLTAKEGKECLSTTKQCGIVKDTRRYSVTGFKSI